MVQDMEHRMTDATTLILLAELLDAQQRIITHIRELDAKMTDCFGKNDAKDDQASDRRAGMEKVWYSPDELAAELGRKPYTAREWARHGRIHAEKKPNSNKWRIHADEVARLKGGGELLRPGQK